MTQKHTPTHNFIRNGLMHILTTEQAREDEKRVMKSWPKFTGADVIAKARGDIQTNPCLSCGEETDNDKFCSYECGSKGGK